MLSSSKGSISNIKVGLSIISSLSCKSYSILGINNLSIGKSKLVISIIKKCFGSLNIVPGNVMGILSILVSSEGSVVVSNSLRKLSFSYNVSSISSFKGLISNFECSLSSSQVSFSFSKNGVSVI
jgi:hypothetical protein